MCSRFFCSLPFFHVAGFLLGIAVVFGRPGGPLSAALMDEIIEKGHIDCIFFPPSILEELTKIPHAVEKLNSLRLIIAGAGK